MKLNTWPLETKARGEVNRMYFHLCRITWGSLPSIDRSIPNDTLSDSDNASV